MTTWRTTWRTTWIPADHFAPDHRDFWAQAPADHYADIQRQLGARDVGVTELPGTGEAGMGPRKATGGAEGLSGAVVALGADEDKRGAQNGAEAITTRENA